LPGVESGDLKRTVQTGGLFPTGKGPPVLFWGAFLSAPCRVFAAARKGHNQAGMTSVKALLGVFGRDAALKGDTASCIGVCDKTASWFY